MHSENLLSIHHRLDKTRSPPTGQRNLPRRRVCVRHSQLRIRIQQRRKGTNNISTKQMDISTDGYLSTGWRSPESSSISHRWQRIKKSISGILYRTMKLRSTVAVRAFADKRGIRLSPAFQSNVGVSRFSFGSTRRPIHETDIQLRLRKSSARLKVAHSDLNERL